jgi:type II secretory pathway component GspD/PulD (secretin)
MNDVYHIDTHRSLLWGLGILVMLLLVSLHPVFGFSSHSKSSSNDMTPSGSKSSTSAATLLTPSIKTLASKAVITCVNSTIKNALIDVLINRPLVNVNGSIRIDPTFVNHTMTDIMSCINKIQNGLTSK